MFEKITKGEFYLPHLAKDDCSCDCGFLSAGEGGDLIATIHKQGDNDGQGYPPLDEAKANAEFITYCFNLQQKYDIGMLEEAVMRITSLLEELDSCSLLTSMNNEIENTEKLLSKIKKQAK